MEEQGFVLRHPAHRAGIGPPAGGGEKRIPIPSNKKKSANPHFCHIWAIVCCRLAAEKVSKPHFPSVIGHFSITLALCTGNFRLHTKTAGTLPGELGPDHPRKAFGVKRSLSGTLWTGKPPAQKNRAHDGQGSSPSPCSKRLAPVPCRSTTVSAVPHAAAYACVTLPAIWMVQPARSSS